jgi:exo-1,4-beta-D-glucosaminidase
VERAKRESTRLRAWALAWAFAFMAACGSSATNPGLTGAGNDASVPMPAGDGGPAASEGGGPGPGADGSIAPSDGGTGIDAATPSDPSHVPLRDGWLIQSSAVATDPGTVISTSAYTPNQWYATSVPTTVLGALVANGVYTDVLSGMNFRSVPGTTYPIGKDFLSSEDNIPMPANSPFAPAWWFRTQFQSPTATATTLHLEGVNYRADIFLNGKQIASGSDVNGTYRRYDFDVTANLVAGQNTLALSITAQQPTELGLDFVDWNPAPADRLMGIIRDAYLVVHGGIEIRDPFVATHLQGTNAALTVGAEVHNATGASITGTLAGTINTPTPTTFSQDITIGAGATSEVSFDPAKFAALTVQNPRLWWPAKLGAQDMYVLDLTFSAGGGVLHEQKIPFGIREITSSLSNGSRLFAINGKSIFIRGAGYTPDILYRQDPARQEAELAYAADLNLNTVRLEGKLENEHFFDVADQLGLLVMPGLMCCDYWQDSPNWGAGDFTVAADSVQEQAMRLRKHPSVLTFLYGSDTAPVAQAEQGYLQALAAASWPNPIQAAAAEPGTTPASGPTGYKMNGPYDYVPPIYWYTDTAHGGAFGFATEISPGAAVPPVESLQAMLGSGHDWPIDSVWDYHVGAKSPFLDLSNYTNALNGRYGAATGGADFALKSQLTAYESLRAMFEAYGRNKYTAATGVIQWMLNNAWPGINWHLFDYYLRPGGAYFGAKRANEYLHVQYSYDDQSVVVVNHQYSPFAGLSATATLYDATAAQVFRGNATLDAAADSSTKTTITVPLMGSPAGVYFLDLALTDKAGALVSSNFYWLTPSPDVMAAPDPSSAWYFEPITTFADFTPLGSLPKATLTGTKTSQQVGVLTRTSVTLKNTSSALAFFTRVQVLAGGSEILPVLWDDNYISILPGATKTVTATYASALAPAGGVNVAFGGWNVDAGTL